MDIISNLENHFYTNITKYGNIPFNKYFRIRVMGTNKCLQTTSDSLDATKNKLVIKPSDMSKENLNELWYLTTHPMLQTGAIICSACWDPKHNYNGEKSIYLCLKQSGNQLILYPINDSFREGIDASFYFKFFPTKSTNEIKQNIQNSSNIEYFKKKIYKNYKKDTELKNLEFINKYQNIIDKYQKTFDIKHIINISIYYTKTEFINILNEIIMNKDDIDILSILYDKLKNIYIAFENTKKDYILTNLGNRHSLSVTIIDKNNVFSGESSFSLVSNDNHAIPLYIDDSDIKYNIVEKDKYGYSKDMITPFSINMFCLQKTTDIYCNYVEELNESLVVQAKSERERKCVLMGIEDCSNTEQFDKCELYKLSEGIVGRKCSPSMIEFHEKQCKKFDIPLRDCTREYLLDTQVNIEGAMMAGKKRELTEIQIQFIDEQLKFMEDRLKQERQFVIDFLEKTEKNIDKRNKIINTIIGKSFQQKESPIDWAVIFIMVFIALLLLYFLK